MRLVGQGEAEDLELDGNGDAGSSAPVEGQRAAVHPGGGVRREKLRQLGQEEVADGLALLGLLPG